MQQNDMKKRIEEVTDNYFLGDIGILSFASNNGSSRPHSPHEAAAKFIDVLRNTIESLGIGDSGDFASGHLGTTAVSALTKLSHGSPAKVGKNKYLIDVNFDGDLHRDSLALDKYDGVDNIAALLNSGYRAGHTVYGVWLGHHHDQRIGSLPMRDGAKFIESAIKDFMSNYATEYGVTNIDIDEVYK